MLMVMTLGTSQVAPQQNRADVRHELAHVAFTREIKPQCRTAGRVGAISPEHLRNQLAPGLVLRKRRPQVRAPGRRLDHIWVTPTLEDSLSSVSVLKNIRGWEKPSDHAPIIIDLDI